MKALGKHPRPLLDLGRDRKAPWIIAAVYLLAVSPSFADDKVETSGGTIYVTSPLGTAALPELRVGTEHLAEILYRLPAVISIMGIEARSHRLENGHSVCIFWTGDTPATYECVCNPDEGETFQFVVVVGEGPGPEPGPDPPDPDPDPELTELAKWVRNKARTINQPDVAKKIADVYAGIAAQIGAGTIKTLPQARKAVTDNMPQPLGQEWKPLGDELLKAFNDSATTLPKAKVLFTQIAIGMYEAIK